MPPIYSQRSGIGSIHQLQLNSWVVGFIMDGESAQIPIVMGSIGCKIASILRGESDIYISLSLPGESAPKDWDFAAPEAILKAAGGAITNLDNQELSYGGSSYEKGGIIVASNCIHTHKNTCMQLKEKIIKYDIYPFKD